MGPAKKSDSEECIICYYWLFNKGYKFKDYVCNNCLDLARFCFNLRDIANTTVKGVDYRCIIYKINKSEAISQSENSVLDGCRHIQEKLKNLKEKNT